jgi:hypothetical protein
MMLHSIKDGAILNATLVVNQVIGATHGVRTRDLNLGKVALYQLS